jgi:protein-tyrosine phosphatase
MAGNRPLLAILVALVAGSLTASAKPQPLDAIVEATHDGRYAVRWTGVPLRTPVDVYLADRPDAPRAALRLLAKNVTDGEAIVSSDLPGRPYFYVRAADIGTWTAERVLRLEGGRNFRDLGGYPTATGRRVKWGKLYRSGSMAGLTPADYEYLGKLGIRVVCDLRTTSERKAEPNKWQEVAKVTYWTRDYETSFGELRRVLASGLPTAEQAKAAMIQGYRELPFEQAPSYRELFKRLAAGEIPLAFNCSAGKDRTGTAAALLLSALGVPREIVVEDYALSDKVEDFHRAFAGKGRERSMLANFPEEVLTAILSSDPDYIRAGLGAIEERHGSIEGYLREELEVTARELNAIRAALLE